MKLLDILSLFVALAVVPALHAQGSPSVSLPSSGPANQPGFGRDATGALPPGSQERLEKGRQSERQKRLVADTDRLLNLATQLKADMDKTTKDTLSIEVIKKAEEIEKLAKSVKERMKG